MHASQWTLLAGAWPSASSETRAGDESQQLPLAPEAGAPENFRVAVAAEVRADHQQTGQVELPLPDSVVKLGVFAHQPSRPSSNFTGSSKTADPILASLQRRCARTLAMERK